MASAGTPAQILDAVSSVIVRDGVRGASMRQVAQEADVSVGLLSYHFDDKESLILAAFDRATTRLLAASIDASGSATDATTRVSAFLRGSFTDEFLAGDYLQLRVSLWAVALTDPAVAKVDADYFDRYAGELRRLIAAARPELSRTAVNSRALDVIAISNGLWLNWARFSDPDDLERGLQHCEAMALAD